MQFGCICLWQKAKKFLAIYIIAKKHERHVEDLNSWISRLAAKGVQLIQSFISPSATARQHQMSAIINDFRKSDPCIEGQCKRSALSIVADLRAVGASSTKNRCADPRGVSRHHESCPKRNIEMTTMQQALYAAMSHKTLMLLDTGKAKVALGTYTCLDQCTHANKRVETSE